MHRVVQTNSSGCDHLAEGGLEEHHRAAAWRSPGDGAWRGPGADAGKSLGADASESCVADAQGDLAAEKDLSHHSVARAHCATEMQAEGGCFCRALAWQRPSENPCQPGAALHAEEPNAPEGAAAGAATRDEAHPEGRWVQPQGAVAQHSLDQALIHAVGLDLGQTQP